MQEQQPIKTVTISVSTLEMILDSLAFMKSPFSALLVNKIVAELNEPLLQASHKQEVSALQVGIEARDNELKKLREEVAELKAKQLTFPAPYSFDTIEDEDSCFKSLIDE